MKQHYLALAAFSLAAFFVSHAARAADQLAGEAPPETPPPMMGDEPEQPEPHIYPAPVAGIKIGENESPAPADRVFATFNYWHDVSPDVYHEFNIDNADVETVRLGFEKTFLDGDASIGVRLPVTTFNLDGRVQAGLPINFAPGSHTELGDINIVGKYAILNDRATGNVVSIGVMVTAPTQPNPFIPIATGNPKPLLDAVRLQPFLGYIFNLNSEIFVQGFLSVEIPTDSRIATAAFSDTGIGWRAYQADAGLITAVTPMFELHLNGLVHNPTVGIPPVPGNFSSIDLTQGVALELNHRAWLTLGVSENLTKPTFYGIEAIAQLNYYF